MEKITSNLKQRISPKDALSSGTLAGSTCILQLFDDAAAELLIRSDGVQGLFLRYNEVEFLAPVHVGDYIQVTGEITVSGRTSRTMAFTAVKVIASRPDIHSSAADVLEEPVLVCRARGVCVIPSELKRD